MIKIKKYSIVASILCLALTGCKSKKEDDELMIPPQVLYETASTHFEAGEYKKASDEFEKIFFQHPGKEITPKAELMQAYSLYRAEEYENAIDILEIFIKLHPRHEYISYAYYLRALASYAQISDLDLDQSKSINALETLNEVIARFGESSYARDAAAKIGLVKEHLAGHEMLIGNYYLKQKNPIAAIGRFQIILQQYSNSSYIAETLYRLIEANLIMGLKQEAIQYAVILDKNYPNSKWNIYKKYLLK
jgi:outer membrane protein assembly factor BamD